jgi:hypothetical protein
MTAFAPSQLAPAHSASDGDLIAGQTAALHSVALEHYTQTIERAAHDLPRIRELLALNGEDRIPLDDNGTPRFPTTAETLLKATNPHTLHLRRAPGGWELTGVLSRCVAAYAVANDFEPLEFGGHRDEFAAWVANRSADWPATVLVHSTQARPIDLMRVALNTRERINDESRHCCWSVGVAGRNVACLCRNVYPRDDE